MILLPKTFNLIYEPSILFWQLMIIPGISCFTLAYVEYQNRCLNQTEILQELENSIPKEGKWFYDYYYETFESDKEVETYDGVHLLFE